MFAEIRADFVAAVACAAFPVQQRPAAGLAGEAPVAAEPHDAAVGDAPLGALVALLPVFEDLALDGASGDLQLRGDLVEASSIAKQVLDGRSLCQG